MNVPTQKKPIIINSLKAFVLLFAASILFVSVLTVFPLIGSLTVKNLQLSTIIKDNFQLMIPMTGVALLISPLLGWASHKLKRRRLLFLNIIAITGTWLVIIYEMLLLSHLAVANEPGSMLMLSVFLFFGYSFLSLPVIVPAIFLFEKWTRKKSP